MRAYRVACALWFVGTVGCDGPLLTVARLREPDAGDSADDARVVSDKDAGRARDAQSDAEPRFPWNPEAHPCGTSRDCDGNEHSQRCHPEFHRCVECFADDQCRSGRCIDEFLECKEPEKPRP